MNWPWQRELEQRLREDLQRCQSRARLALDALTSIRALLIADEQIPVVTLSRIMAHLTRLEALLSAEAGGGPC